MEIEEKQVV